MRPSRRLAWVHSLAWVKKRKGTAYKENTGGLKKRLPVCTNTYNCSYTVFNLNLHETDWILLENECI